MHSQHLLAVESMARDVMKDASEYKQMSYDHYKCLAINKNGSRLLTCTNVLQVCFLCELYTALTLSRISYEWAYKCERECFRSVTNAWQSSCIIANWWQIAFVSLFAKYSLTCMCKSSIKEHRG